MSAILFSLWLYPDPCITARSLDPTRFNALASYALVKWTQEPSHRAPRDETRDGLCPPPRTKADCRCDVSWERPLITSRPKARSYASRERKLWWKKVKIKRFASGYDKIWDSRSIEGKDKLSTDPLTAILASLELRAGTVSFRVPSLPIFLTVSTTQNIKRR